MPVTKKGNKQLKKKQNKKKTEKRRSKQTIEKSINQSINESATVYIDNARLAQLPVDKRRSAEREAAGSSPGRT